MSVTTIVSNPQTTANLRSNLWNAETKTLSGRWRDAERDNVQLLEAYGNLAAGCIDLYEATLDPETLSFALVLAERILAVFLRCQRGRLLSEPGWRERFDPAGER